MNLTENEPDFSPVGRRKFGQWEETEPFMVTEVLLK